MNYITRIGSGEKNCFQKHFDKNIDKFNKLMIEHHHTGSVITMNGIHHSDNNIRKLY